MWECPQLHKGKLAQAMKEFAEYNPQDAPYLYQNWNFSYGLNAVGTPTAGERGTDWREYWLGMSPWRGRKGVPQVRNGWKATEIPIRASEVRAPSAMIMLADRACYGRSGSYNRLYFRGDTDPGYWDIIILGVQMPRLSNLSRRHSGKVNVLFADGHVDVESLKELTLPQPENMRRWNYDNRPHEEHWQPVNPSEWESYSWEEVEKEN